MFASNSFHTVPIVRSPGFRATASAKEHHAVPFEPRTPQKTAKIAAISTCSNKNLHFSRIFQPIALAFSYRVRYSPLGSGFFAHVPG
jgi:hypothetical protein